MLWGLLFDFWKISAQFGRPETSARRRVVERKWLRCCPCVSKLFVWGISTFNLSRLSAGKPRPRSRAAAAACVRLFAANMRMVNWSLSHAVAGLGSTAGPGQAVGVSGQQLLFPTAPTGRMFPHMFALSAQTTKQTPETSQTLLGYLSNFVGQFPPGWVRFNIKTKLGTRNGIA